MLPPCYYVRRTSDLLDRAADDEDVWIVVIAGNGAEAFCAGGDVKSWRR